MTALSQTTVPKVTSTSTSTSVTFKKPTNARIPFIGIPPLNTPQRRLSQMYKDKLKYLNQLVSPNKKQASPKRAKLQKSKKSKESVKPPIQKLKKKMTTSRRKKKRIQRRSKSIKKLASRLKQKTTSKPKPSFTSNAESNSNVGSTSKDTLKSLFTITLPISSLGPLKSARRSEASYAWDSCTHLPPALSTQVDSLPFEKETPILTPLFPPPPRSLQSPSSNLSLSPSSSTGFPSGPTTPKASRTSSSSSSSSSSLPSTPSLPSVYYPMPSSPSLFDYYLQALSHHVSFMTQSMHAVTTSLMKRGFMSPFVTKPPSAPTSLSSFSPTYSTTFNSPFPPPPPSPLYFNAFPTTFPKSSPTPSVSTFNTQKAAAVLLQLSQSSYQINAVPEYPGFS